MGEGKWADRDVAIQRLTDRGWVAWTRVLADPGVKDSDMAYAVGAADPLIAVAGYACDGDAELPVRAWLARIAPTGSVRWSETWGPPGGAAPSPTGSRSPRGESSWSPAEPRATCSSGRTRLPARPHASIAPAFLGR